LREGSTLQVRLYFACLLSELPTADAILNDGNEKAASVGGFD
jgi:hypothetical protein